MVLPRLLFFLMRFSPLLLQLLFQHGSAGVGLSLWDLQVCHKKNNYLIGECYADCYADVMLKRKKNNNLGQTHFHSLYLLSPELRLLSGLLAVRTVTVVLQKQAFEGFKTSG